MKKRVAAAQQAFDFAGYDYYLLPETQRILFKQIPLPASCERIPTDSIRLQLHSAWLAPTIPANSIVWGQLIQPADLLQRGGRLLAALVGDVLSGEIEQFYYGRLVIEPGGETNQGLLLRPENPAYKPQRVALSPATFWFLLTQYRPIDQKAAGILNEAIG